MNQSNKEQNEHFVNTEIKKKTKIESIGTNVVFKLKMNKYFKNRLMSPPLQKYL